MQLQTLVDFYKRTAKEWIDKVNLYETVNCNHFISYFPHEGTGISKVHEFSIQIDDMKELFIEATVSSQEEQTVSHWQIRHQFVPMSETYIFWKTSERCDDETLLKYIAQCGCEPVGFSDKVTYVSAELDRGVN